MELWSRVCYSGMPKFVLNTFKELQKYSKRNLVNIFIFVIYWNMNVFTGEFGIVYKARLSKEFNKPFSEVHGGCQNIKWATS